MPTSILRRSLLLFCFAGCICLPSFSQDLKSGPISISAGSGVLSDSYLSRHRKSLIQNQKLANDDAFIAFPIIFQSQLSFKIVKELRGIVAYTYEPITSQIDQHGALLGCQYLYPVSEKFRVYADLALGIRVRESDQNTLHLGYKTTQAGIQYGRSVYVDIGFGGGMGGLLTCKLGWLMPPLKSKT